MGAAYNRISSVEFGVAHPEVASRASICRNTNSDSFSAPLTVEAISVYSRRIVFTLSTEKNLEIYSSASRHIRMFSLALLLNLIWSIRSTFSFSQATARRLPTASPWCPPLMIPTIAARSASAMRSSYIVRVFELVPLAGGRPIIASAKASARVAVRLNPELSLNNYLRKRRLRRGYRRLCNLVENFRCYRTLRNPSLVGSHGMPLSFYELLWNAVNRLMKHMAFHEIFHNISWHFAKRFMAFRGIR